MASQRTKTLAFENEEALRVALTSGLIPPEVQECAACAAAGEDGAIAIAPAAPLAEATLRALRRAGVRVGEPVGEGARPIRCWAEAVTVERAGDSTEPASGLCLFLLPDGASTLGLAGEMLRLGCDRLHCCFDAADGSAALIRAVDPPYYTVACAMERADGPRAFAPAEIGQERVWVEVGHRHPLARSLRAPDGQLLLLPARGPWLSVPDGPWTDVYALAELRLPTEPLARAGGLPERRLPVTLRLGRAARGIQPTLWVLGEGAVAQLDRLVQTLPEEVIGRLLFAASGGPDPVIVIRARLGREAPPELVVSGAAYAPLLQIGNLYVPADALVEPPLRRERLREVLAPEPERVYWLAATPDPPAGTFRVESLPESSFLPLRDWVDYLVHAEAQRLEPWVRAAVFELEPFESIGGEWAAEPPPPEYGDDDDDRRRRRRRREPVEREDEPTPVALMVAEAEAPAPAPPARGSELATAFVERSADAAEERTLAEVERRFLDLDSPADDPARQPLWQQMAEILSRLGRGRDAGLCWTRTLWELRDAEAPSVAARWAHAELRLAQKSDAEALVRAVLARADTDRDAVRSIASALTLAALQPAELRPLILTGAHLREVQTWLDAHDGELDVRALWLARSALARLSGGDRLGLARTRDRILGALHGGLSVERDVPAFLRFCGRDGGGRDTAAVSKLAANLEALLERFESTKRKRSAVEAAVEHTRAYVHLCFAYGFARLGQPDRARALREGACAGLNLKDAIHGYLARAYSARIDHALEGLAAETPLPSAVAGELNEMQKFLRYKVDRLRQASTILEPQERLDPIRAFSQGARDPRGEEFLALRGMTDLAELHREVERLMALALAGATPPEERARLFDGLMDFLPQLPEAQALPPLQTLVRNLEGVAPARQVSLLEEALMLAGFFGRAELARSLVARLKELCAALSESEAAEVGSMLGACLRGLRRVGLREEAADLLRTTAASLRLEGIPALIVRIQLAAGLASLGHLEGAREVFKEADLALQAKTLQPGDRIQLARALASAMSQTPHDYAVQGLARIAQQLPLVTDSFNTNSHFCLSVIQFMEGLILGYASEDLALGDVGRRWLDEDEYLVRRRINRDLGESA